MSEIDIDFDQACREVACIFHARGCCFCEEECMFAHGLIRSDFEDPNDAEILEQQCRSQLRAIKQHTNQAMLPAFPPDEQRCIAAVARRMHLQVCFSSAEGCTKEQDAVLTKQRIKENFFRRGHSGNRRQRGFNHNHNYELVYLPVVKPENQNANAFESPAVRRRKVARERSRSSRRSRSASVARSGAESTEECGRHAPDTTCSNAALPQNQSRKVVRAPAKTSEKNQSQKKVEKRRRKREAKKSHDLEDEFGCSDGRDDFENGAPSQQTASVASRPQTKNLHLKRNFCYLAGEKNPAPFQFDIRDEICEHFNFWQHGDRVWLLEYNVKATVIGVGPLQNGLRLFVHIDGARGAVPACPESMIQIGLPIRVQQLEVTKKHSVGAQDVDAELLRKLDAPRPTAIRMQLKPDLAGNTLTPYMLAVAGKRAGSCQICMVSILHQQAECFYALCTLPGVDLSWLDSCPSLAQRDDHRDSGSDLESGSKNVRFANDRPPADEVDKVIRLSSEQSLAVSTSCSSFVQGRSGTGKTLILVKRMIQHRSKMQQMAKKKVFKQLFITKSSLLCEEVFFQLKTEACLADTNAWPLRDGVVVLTWNQLLVKVLGRDVADDVLVTFAVFIGQYWPELKSSARGLPPELVWAEFNTRLRPFGPAMAMGTVAVGVWHASFEEYFNEDCSAMGVGLNRHSQAAIFDMFKKYRKMKQEANAQDEVDRALIVSQAIAKAKEQCDALYVDEIQDFHPAEICSLLDLCKDIDAITMAGDTCQTVNPGSAFSFDDLLKAFRKYRSGRLIDTVQGKAVVHEIDFYQEEAARADRLASQAAETQKKRARQNLIASALYRSGHKSHSRNIGAIMQSSARSKVDDLALTAHFAQERQHQSEQDFEKLTSRFVKLTLHFNYRCTPGVARLASSVTQLLLQRFPRCADAIVEDSIQTDERLPIHIRIDGSNPADILMGTDAQRIDHIDESRILIVVPTCRMRDNLKDSGVRGLILTAPEAKGLEFDIVIICGLCSGECTSNLLWSIADDQSLASQALMWAAKESGELESVEREMLNSLSLAILELKRLYVGISRARIGCVLLEFDPVAGDAFSPMVRRWERQNLIEQWTDFDSSSSTNSSKPSLVTALEKRYGKNTDGFAIISKLKSRGEQLLKHAQDEPIQRSAIFLEAANVLLHTLRSLRQWFRSQLHDRMDSGDAPLVVDVKAAYRDWAGLEESLAAIVQDVGRQHDWRSGTYLAMLQGQRSILCNIFDFLVPVDKSANEMLDDIAKKVCYHDSMAYQVKQLIFCAHGWHNTSVAQQQFISRGQLLKLKESIRACAAKFTEKLPNFASAKSRRKVGKLQSDYYVAVCFRVFALPVFERKLELAEQDLYRKKELEEEAERRFANSRKAQEKASNKLRNLYSQRDGAEAEHRRQQSAKDWWLGEIEKYTKRLADAEASVGSRESCGDALDNLRRDVKWSEDALKKCEAALQKANQEIESAESKIAHATAVHEKLLNNGIQREKEMIQAAKAAHEAVENMDDVKAKLKSIRRSESSATRLLQKEVELQAKMFKESQSDFVAWKQRALELRQLSRPVADRFSAAGRAFLLSSDLRKAADAFESAAELSGCAHTSHDSAAFNFEPCYSFKSLWWKVPFVRSASIQYRTSSHWSAHCKLLLARKDDCSNKRMLMAEAESRFAAAEAYNTAALCAIEAGNFRSALHYLLKSSPSVSKQLLLLCAFQISKSS